MERIEAERKKITIGMKPWRKLKRHLKDEEGGKRVDRGMHKKDHYHHEERSRRPRKKD